MTRAGARPNRRPLYGVLASFAISLTGTRVAVAAIGLSPAILVAGVAYLVATTLPGLRPEWKEMDRRPAADEPATTPERELEHAA